MTDADYRAHLVETRQKSQQTYDNAVLVLSAGALGVTINFVKEVVRGEPHVVWLLTIAWACWGISCACILYSHFASVLAHREAIAAWDENREAEQALDKVTNSLNAASGGLFLLGLLLFCTFALYNLNR